MQIINYKQISLFFFIAFLIIGLAVYKDYGINWDDSASRYNGLTNWSFIFENNQHLFTCSERYHGPALETLLIGVEKLFALEDSREIMLAHHLVDFLIFYLAAIAFFLSAKILFGEYKWALFATLALVLSPRIFAEAFYNSKDLGFLSAMIFSFYTLLRIKQHPSVIWWLLHGIATGFAIDIRILGVVIFPVSLYFFFNEAIQRADVRKKYLVLGSLYPLLLFGCVIAFWPVLWNAPGFHLERAFLEMKKYPWIGWVHYLNQYVPSANLPWHYLPVWISITTPFPFIALGLAGGIWVLKDFATGPINFIKHNALWGAIFFMAFGPLAVIIYMKPVVYDAWRHVYFIYPFFILLAVYTLWHISEKVKEQYKKTVTAACTLLFVFLTGVNIYMHPHQNVYFNLLSIQYFKPIEKQFETDYWGLSYKQGLEYLLRNNSGKAKIKVSAINDAGYANRDILKKEDRDRFDFIESISESDFCVSNYRQWGKPFPPPYSPIYEIKRFDIPILTIYKIHHATDSNALNRFN